MQSLEIVVVGQFHQPAEPRFYRVEGRKTELGRRFGFAGFPIIDLNTKFLKPIRYDDQVQIYSTITSLKKSSFELRHCLTKGEVVAVECMQTRVWCIADSSDPKKLKSSPVPEELVALLKRGNTV